MMDVFSKQISTNGFQVVGKPKKMPTPTTSRSLNLKRKDNTETKQFCILKSKAYCEISLQID